LLLLLRSLAIPLHDVHEEHHVVPLPSVDCGYALARQGIEVNAVALLALGIHGEVPWWEQVLLFSEKASRSHNDEVLCGHVPFNA